MEDMQWLQGLKAQLDEPILHIIGAEPGGEETLLIWLNLLCVAYDCHNGGDLILGEVHLNESHISTFCRCTVESARYALETFEHFGLISVHGETITVKCLQTNEEKERPAAMNKEPKL